MSETPHSHGLVHKHFIFDAELTAALDFSKRQEITHALIDDLLSALGMEKLGPLEIYDAADAEYPGWSFIQPITTSHISGHYFEEKEGVSHIRMDVYSCKNFDEEEVIKIAHTILGTSKWSGTLIARNIDITQREITSLEGRSEKIAEKRPYILQ